MKRLGTLLAIGLVLSGLAACGGDDTDGAGDTAAGAGPPTDGAGDTAAGAGPTTTVAADADASFPVTIEHRYGTTTFDAPPERIVSLDDQWTDVLSAIDGPLVGAAENPGIEGGRLPWQHLGDAVESIAVADQIPFEAVAALQPDLIVITWAVVDQTTYDRLAEIAPTVGPLGDEQVDRWQDIATTAGRILGREASAAQLIADAEAVSADVLRALPGLEGLDYALANYIPGDAVYVVADPDDGASELFAQLGMSIDPDLLAVADGASGRAELSLEQVGMLDSDVLILLTHDADPDDIPGYANLPAVRSGAVAILDLATVSGLNTPSPLSIPYALDAIRPALEAAAAGS